MVAVPVLGSSVDTGSPVDAFLRRAHERHLANRGGAVATYIPELARADPQAFGIVSRPSTASSTRSATRGRRSRSSRSRSRSPTPRSSSCTARRPSDAGSGWSRPATPSTRSRSAPATGLPLNPMVNAGAITAIGMVPPEPVPARPARAQVDRPRPRRPPRRLAGPVRGPAADLDEAVYRSERDTGHRNRAIAHLLRGTGAIDDDPEAVVDAYFRSAPSPSTARDLALIAATLATAAGTRARASWPRARTPSATPCRSWPPAACTTAPANGCSRSASRRRAACPAASSRSCRASSASASGRPGSTRVATASGGSPCAATSPASSTSTSSAASGRRRAVRTRASVAALPSKRATRRPRARAHLASTAPARWSSSSRAASGSSRSRRWHARRSPPGRTRRRGHRPPAGHPLDPAVTPLLADLVAGLGARGAAVAWSGPSP